MMTEKTFGDWILLKDKLHNRNKIPVFKQAEIWWCSIGFNVGHEENGKNQLFNRPILVLRKFNNHLFLGVPLTSKIKENIFYRKISFKGMMQSVMIAQMRVMDSKRLTHKMGEMSEEQFQMIRREVKEMI